MFLVDDIREAVGPGNRANDDAAAIAAVAAVGAALGDVFLAPKADAAASAVAAFDVDGDSIDKHRIIVSDVLLTTVAARFRSWRVISSSR